MALQPEGLRESSRGLRLGETLGSLPLIFPRPEWAPEPCLHFSHVGRFVPAPLQGADFLSGPTRGFVLRAGLNPGLDSGTRIATTNGKGEREFMSDEARAAESKRVSDIISRECQGVL